MKKKVIFLFSIFLPVLGLDLITKKWALNALGDGIRMEIFFGYIPLTLAFNRGAAFGISLGNDPRWFFISITLLALILLLTLLKQSETEDLLRIISVSLILSGALGNLYDRVRWDMGVVDFLGPIDIGFMLWPIFNVADMAISCGAVLLAISFWLEDRRISYQEP